MAFVDEDLELIESDRANILAAPAAQLPFACGEAWRLDTWGPRARARHGARADWFNGVEYGQANGMTWRNVTSANCGSSSRPRAAPT